MKEHKYACSTTSTKAPSKQAKKEKINQYSGDVKQNFIFLAPKYQNKQYQKAMDELTTFVYIGDNEHDDAADGVTQLAITLLKQIMVAICMLVKAQALDYLFKNKIHPLIALITCGLFSDPQKVYEMSLPYLGTIYPELADPEAEMQKAQQLLDGKFQNPSKTEPMANSPSNEE